VTKTFLIPTKGCDKVKYIMAMAEEWMTAGEAAEYLKIKPRTLLLLVRQGKLPAFALSGTKRRVWRFRSEDLDTALLSRPVLTLDGSLPVRSNDGRTV
jgi:excisionase family DNA binding protein